MWRLNTPPHTHPTPTLSHQRQTKTLKREHAQARGHTGLLMDNAVSGVHRHTRRYPPLTFAATLPAVCAAPACKTTSAPTPVADAPL